MFFSQEDYKKIQLWLQKNAIKDTEFNDGVLPLNGEETIALVQNKQNIKVFLKDFIAQLALLGSPDFINISDKFGEKYISLSQAIKLIPYRSRKIGQVITFLDEFSEWRVYQFQGERVNQWNNTTLWIDLLQAISDSSNIVPDEEDITGVLQGGRNLLKFKDKNYNKDDYSGLGRVFLRKNLTTVTDPSTMCEISTNLLTQEMISRDNTIYIIQYDYDLNNQTITIPKNCILDFQGGSIKNGTIILTNSIIRSDVRLIINCTCTGSVLNSTLYPEWFGENDFTDAIQTCINIAKEGAQILFTKDKYLVRGGNLIFKSGLTFESYNKSTIYTNEPTNYRAIFDAGNVQADNVTFRNLNFDQSAQENCEIVTDSVQMYCIISYRSYNLTVENCNFTNVGTNCVVVNGQSCGNTKILNNRFNLIRVKTFGDYDNSIIYINDKSHIISGNIILNDNTEANRSRGGIESHGYIGIVSGNIIYNCYNAINVVTDTSTHDNDELANRIISNNTCNNCERFVQLWAAGNYPLRNILITGNKCIGVVSVVRSVIATNLLTDLKNIVISNNSASGLKGTITDITSSDETYNAAFVFFAYGNHDVCIKNNYLVDFPHYLITTSHWMYNETIGYTVKNITFINNICKNCFNSTYESDSYSSSMYYSLFNFGYGANALIRGNVIDIDDTDRNNALYLLSVRNENIEHIDVLGNVFTDCKTYLIRVPQNAAGLISTDIESLYYDIDSRNVYPSENVYRHLYPNDIILQNKEIIKITSKGVNDTFVKSGTIHIVHLTQQYGYIHGDGLEALSLGDCLQITIGSASTIRTIYIHYIVNGKYYYIMDTSISPVEDEINSISYLPPSREIVYDISLINSHNSLEIDDRTFAIDTIYNNQIVSRNGDKLQDCYGFTNTYHRGTTSILNNSVIPALGSSDQGFQFYDTNERRLKVYDGSKMVNPDGSPIGMRKGYGSNSSAPTTYTEDNTGSFYFNELYNSPNWWDGEKWVDYAGVSKHLPYGTSITRDVSVTPNMLPTDIGSRYYDKTLNKPVYWDGTQWRDTNGFVALPTLGPTSNRPKNASAGFQYFDTSLNKPIYWTGSKWVDANGTNM